MEFEFESIKKFEDTLYEVEVLIENARNAKQSNDDYKYKIYNKSALLLLSAKFENFIERITKEYIGYINSLGISSDKIPEELKVKHSLYVLEQSKSIMQHKHKINKMVKVLKELGDLWGNERAFSSLNVNTKFDYGEHGEEGLKKLFENIGFDDVLERGRIFERVDDSLVQETKEIDFKGKFNSMTGFRNHIIHEDGTPALTHENIEDLKNSLYLFATELVVKLNEKLDELAKLCA